MAIFPYHLICSGPSPALSESYIKQVCCIGCFPCPGYLSHPLVFIKFEANLVRLGIYSVNRHTIERLIRSTWHSRDLYQKACIRPIVGQIQAFVHTIYPPRRCDPPSPQSVKSWGPYRLSICWITDVGVLLCKGLICILEATTGGNRDWTMYR
jgi:hypothetical protein